MAAQRIAAELEKMMTSISTARLPKGFTETIANVDGVKINYKIGGRGPVDVWLLRDLWHFHFYGDVPLALVKGRERIYFEHFWNDFAADKTKSVPEADRRIYAAAYARANGMRAGFEYFRNFERDAEDFAQMGATRLAMPVLVFTGEKASGNFLIEQAKLVASNVRGQVVMGSGHWLMEEARNTVIPAITDFIS